MCVRAHALFTTGIHGACDSSMQRKFEGNVGRLKQNRGGNSSMCVVLVKRTLTTRRLRSSRLKCHPPTHLSPPSASHRQSTCVYFIDAKSTFVAVDALRERL